MRGRWHSRRKRFSLAYGLAAVGIPLATALAYALAQLWPLASPAALQLPLVLAAALLGGWGAGSAALLLAGAAMALLFPIAWPDLLLLGLGGLGLCGLAQWLRREEKATAEGKEGRTAAEATDPRRASEAAPREETEAQLRQAQKMEALGQLTGGIAHDFNNLLTAIIGNLEIVQRRMPPDASPATGRAVTHALQACQRAAALTQRLLAFARRQSLDPRPTDVSRLVAGMSDLLRRVLGEKIQVETHLAEDLWLTQIDDSQLENTVLNLAVNARDAMPQGGRLTLETANVTLDAGQAARQGLSEGGDYVLLRVADDGVGMPPEVLARVFDPFFTTKPAGRGTGLGLSQVYGFVKQSGGHIAIESSEGAGTKITIHLPRLERSAPEASQAAAEREKEELPPPPAVPAAPVPLRRRILLVEDEPLVAMATAEALQAWGFDVEEAHSISAAQGALRAAGEPFFLAIIDVGLPDGRGDHLARALAEQNPNLILIVTSGYETQDLSLPAEEAGRCLLLAKPYEIARLKQILDRLQGKGQEPPLRQPRSSRG